MIWPFQSRRDPAADAEAYQYAHRSADGLMFVGEFPEFELAYRDACDLPAGKTWAALSMDAQLAAIMEYVQRALVVSGWGERIVTYGKRFAAVGQARGYSSARRKEDFGNVRLGQRLLTGVGKAAALHAPQRTLRDYIDIAASPCTHLDVTDLLQDRAFGYLRVGGMNPVLLRTAQDSAHVAHCGELAVIEAALRARQDALGDALAQRRLYVVDPSGFEILRDHLTPSREPEHPHARRFVSFPTAVFVRPAQGRHPVPVAIRCAPALATLTPAAPAQQWLRAKLHYAVADGLYHTFVSHLPHTHFAMEAIVIAARRVFGTGQHGRAHPIGRLLDPHLDGTLAINRVARGTVLDGASPFADFVGCDVHSTTRLLGAALQQRRDRFETLPAAHDLVADPELDFPFRDDFTGVGDVLAQWVSAYVTHHYADDAAVRGDAVLQRWAAEIRHPAQGRTPGFAPLHDRTALVTGLTTVVQLASIQHAAIHFPQTDLGRQVLLSPFYAADVPPGYHGDKDEISVLDSLPSLHAAMWQASLFRLSKIRWRSLATLPSRFWTEPGLQPAVAALASGLQAQGERITARNDALRAAGLPAYEYLLPALAPCSINA